MKKGFFATIVTSILVTIPPANGQNFSGDARKIGMGGVGFDHNITTKMIEEQRPYAPVVLPLSLIQILQDLDRFDPDDERFDPLLVLEYAANPIHYVFGRRGAAARGAFVEDLANGELKRDLNNYRGFVPASESIVEGLVSPNWGPTIKFVRRADGTFHGIYAGVGPYLSARTAVEIDTGLIDLLAGPTAEYRPDRSFRIADVSSGQLALAMTVGYRGRIALRGKSSAAGREGVYIGANYHYLYGFGHASADVRIRLDTDAAGLLTVVPSTIPISVDYLYARRGSGLAMDFGAGIVTSRWELGFGVNGVGNRIEWRRLEGRRYTMRSLVEGSDFVEEAVPLGFDRIRVELPVRYIGSAAYYRGAWTVRAEICRGFHKTSFHGGVERRIGAIELRAGGRFSRGQWHPAAGLGFNLGRRFSIDVAGFTTSANIERKRNPAMAASLRFNPRTK